MAKISESRGSLMKLLANVLSILSLLFGFASIIFSIEGTFTLSSWAIIFSVVFDGIDGQVARIDPAPSEFGKELDSLVDVISFGIAPVILGYSFIYQRTFPVAAVILFLYLFCSVLRLAKYNITPKEEMRDYFYGLPTTVAGGLLASFVLVCWQGGARVFISHLLVLFLSLVLLLSLLMVSRLRYPNLDGLKKILWEKFKLTLLALLVLFIAALALNKAGLFLFVIFLIYLIFSPFVVKRLNSNYQS